MRTALIVALITVVQFSVAQTFSSSPGLFLPDLTTVTDDITVTGVGTIDCSYGLTEVCIDISHTRNADMEVFLIDPNGDSYELTTDNGGTSDNYSGTCFDMTAATAVTAGTGPFSGSYVPEGNLGLVNNDQDADGTWSLQIRDDRSGRQGTLNSWEMTFDSSPPCPPVPTTEDCAGGITVCSDETFTGNSSGSGNYTDLTAANDGCLNGENESSWYYFQAATDGTFAFEIVTAVDYDFAVWGPMASIECPPVGSPIRCSYSGTAGNTGLSAGAGDDTEGSGGDAFVNDIHALEDEIYIIVIDNFTADGSSFDLDWTLSGGATLDCTPLPVELSLFMVNVSGNANELKWKTASELNCSHYEIEWSEDGINWTELAMVAGAGNSSEPLTYYYTDYYRRKTINYYKLVQVDFDGDKEVLGVKSIDNRSGKEIVKIVNLVGQEVDDNYDGIKVYVYADGTIAKVVTQN